MGDIPPHDDADDFDGLSALGYSFDYGDADAEESNLAALCDYVPAGRSAHDVDSTDDDFPAVGFASDAAYETNGSHGTGSALYVVDTPDAGVAEPEGALYTVTNPPGTVTVTSFLDGRVQQIDLAPRLAGMTEADLADEIVAIAGLATMDARSAQYSFMLDGMRQHGHSDVATREFLARDMELPSPEQADARRAEVFATRYEGSHE